MANKPSPAAAPRRGASEAPARGDQAAAPVPPAEASDQAANEHDDEQEAEGAAPSSSTEVRRPAPSGRAAIHPALTDPDAGPSVGIRGQAPVQRQQKRKRPALVLSPQHRAKREQQSSPAESAEEDAHQDDDLRDAGSDAGSEDGEEGDDGSEAYDDDAFSSYSASSASTRKDPSDSKAVGRFLQTLPHGVFGSLLEKDERKTLLRRYALPRVIGGRAPSLNDELHAAFEAKHVHVDTRADAARISRFDQQRQVLTPMLAAMAALAEGDRASAATALQDAATLAVANIATTVLERRIAILTPMGRGFVPLAKAPQRCEPGTPLFDTARLVPAIEAQHKLIAAVSQAASVGKADGRPRSSGAPRPSGVPGHESVTSSRRSRRPLISAIFPKKREFNCRNAQRARERGGGRG